jgi:uncharacterized membrane protein (UPF0136 family)
MSHLLVFYYLIFGVLTIAGGVVGFVKAKSKASLIAGGISGLLLIGASYMLWHCQCSNRAGLILALVVSVALAGRFLPGFLKTKKWMPAGLMAVLSVIGIVLGILGFLH